MSSSGRQEGAHAGALFKMNHALMCLKGLLGGVETAKLGVVVVNSGAICMTLRQGCGGFASFISFLIFVPCHLSF